MSHQVCTLNWGRRAAGRQLLLENPNSAPAELLLFEFKTETVKPVDEKRKK